MNCVQPKQLISCHQVIATLKKEYTFVQHLWKCWDQSRYTTGCTISFVITPWKYAHVFLYHAYICHYSIKISYARNMKGRLCTSIPWRTKSKQQCLHGDIPDVQRSQIQSKGFKQKDWNYRPWVVRDFPAMSGTMLFRLLGGTVWSYWPWMGFWLVQAGTTPLKPVYTSWGSGTQILLQFHRDLKLSHFHSQAHWIMKLIYVLNYKINLWKSNPWLLERKES